MYSLRVSVDTADLNTIAEWLNAGAAGECASAQHDAIARTILTRVVASAWIARLPECPTPAMDQLMQREYADHARAVRARAKLPPSRRTV